MPLKKGSSRNTVSSNVKELVDKYEDTGKIGTSRPASKKKAVKQAVAISLKKAGKSKYYNNSTAKKTSGKKGTKAKSRSKKS